jgi:HEAT repeat protein
MDRTLKKICGLLKSPDALRRCGAALVISELSPKSKDVVKALGEALPDASEQLTTCILDAMQSIGSPAAVPYVMPLLLTQDVATRMRAVGIVACGGKAVVPEIKRQLKNASRQQKLVFIDILARIHNNETIQMLLDMLFEPDFSLVKETCDAVKRHAGAAQPKERLKLHKQVVRFMNTSRVRKQERILTSSLLLIGHIGRPEAAAILLKYSTPKTLPYVRRHALIALKGVEFAGRMVSSTLRKIFPYLNEDDEEIVRHTLEITGRMPSSAIKDAQWRKLLQSKHGSVRAFAARMLSGIDTVENNKLLLDLLNHQDMELREIAASSLAAHKKATPFLLRLLAAEKNPETAWRIAKILKPHLENIDKQTIKKFTSIAAKEMLAGTPRHEPLLYFVHYADPKATEKLLLDTGMQHKRAKRWGPAVDCLRRLLHTEIFNDDISYALSICDLKVSKKELSIQYRAEDHALRGLLSLFRHNAPNLLARLKKDKTLNASDIFYAGFHFSDSAGDERLFGEELLKHVVKKWPRSREAKEARARLKK